MYKKLMVLTLVLALAGLVSADTQWANTTADWGDWEDNDNWTLGAPDDADALVKVYIATAPSIAKAEILANRSVSGGVKLQMKYLSAYIKINSGATLRNSGSAELFQGTVAQADILSGGTWNAVTSGSGQFKLGAGSASAGNNTVNVWGTLNVVSEAGTAGLVICTDTRGSGSLTGTLNIYEGGVVNVDAYAMADYGTSRINIHGLNATSGVMTVKGDVTGQVAADAGAGRILCPDGILKWQYYAGSNLTKIWNIPEPATMVLLGLGGLLLRRKRR